MIKYLVEIKNRVFLLFLSNIFIVLITYYYKEILLFLIITKKNSGIDALNFYNADLPFHFIFTDVTEIFSVCISLVFFISTQVTAAFFCYHIFLFLSPAMFLKEYKFLLLFTKVIFLIWFLSTLASNIIIIPVTWNFFLSFHDLIVSKSFNVHFEAKLTEYVSFYISIYYICGLYFQLFVLIFFLLNYINTKINSIKKFRKIYYFGFVIFSTTISPPDLATQILLSFFFMLAYELALFIFLIKTFKSK